jgi:hypothetical protein
MSIVLNPAANKTLDSQQVMYYYTSVIQSLKYQIYELKLNWTTHFCTGKSTIIIVW